MEILSKDLTDNQKKLMDLILTETDERFDKVKYILKESAELSGRQHKDIVLFKHQVTPVLMMQVSKRVLNGFSPGIGKTYSACGSYAMYRYKCIKNGTKPGKVLCVTEGTHLFGFKNDWNSGGVNLLPLYDGTDKINRQLKKAQESDEEYDGIVTTWDSLKTNGFLMYFLENFDDYNFAIFDETNALMNPKSMIYQTVNKLVNKYSNGIEYVMFLNGTSFNKNIYDIYNQMNILAPKLIPSKGWLDRNFVIKEEKEIWTKKGGNKVLNRYLDIVDYKNQEEFKNCLKYYYIVKNKKDVKDNVPTHIYKLHGVNMSPTIKKIIKEKGVTKDINSPNTSFGIDLTRKKFPKFDYLINRFEATIEDRPIIYVYYRDAQKVIKKELERLGYKVGVLSGEIKDKKDKDEIIDKFNNKEYDTLVFNIEKAINLPTSDRIIFYDIPITPTTTNQIKARIDRNNYEDVKFYDFLCYLGSREMVSLAQLSYFREEHGMLLSGQGDDKVYSQLVSQLEEIYDKEVLESISDVVDTKYSSNKDWLDIEDDISKLLGII